MERGVLGGQPRLTIAFTQMRRAVCQRQFLVHDSYLGGNVRAPTALVFVGRPIAVKDF